uniref:Uncharacterized protein n=1 Tax=Anopheles farauti TaxID=69004 RepID=A0A182QH84_9DIPT
MLLLLLLLLLLLVVLVLLLQNRTGNGAESTISEWAGPGCCDHDGTIATCRPDWGHATFGWTAFVSSIRWPDDGSTIETGTGTFTYCWGGTCSGGCIDVPPTTTCLVGLGIVW